MLLFAKGPPTRSRSLLLVTSSLRLRVSPDGTRALATAARSVGTRPCPHVDAGYWARPGPAGRGWQRAMCTLGAKAQCGDQLLSTQ